jgi:hypothetical protein
MIEAYSQSGLSSIASFAIFGTDQFAGEKINAPGRDVLRKKPRPFRRPWMQGGSEDASEDSTR